MELLPLPLTFRQAEVTQIANALRAGESCTVVGIGSAGKSNMLRFLHREDVRRTYLGDPGNAFLFVYTDGNKLIEPSSWALIELMLHQLGRALAEREDGQEILATIDDLHQRAAMPETRFLSIRYLDRAVSAVRRQLGVRLVFLMDDLDSLFRTLPAHGFSALRAVRDDHKYNLMYVVATRLEWERLRENLSEAEAFEELVSAHMVWLGPSAQDDARFMLRRMETRYGTPLSESATRQILSATGGHPGLLRAAYRIATKHVGEPRIPLSSSSRIQAECRRIWHSLASDEQRVLAALASGVQVGGQREWIVEGLSRKRIINGSKQMGYQIFSPLLARYVDAEKPRIGAQLQLDRESRIVWVNGLAVRGLAPLEWDLIDYLDQRRGEACSRDDLIDYLYPGSEGDRKAEGNALEAVVKRLRDRLGPESDRRRYVQTERGFGYRLVQDTDRES
jgi:DNA-binding winged helix-turn-helix (wHTH) protein